MESSGLLEGACLCTRDGFLACCPSMMMMWPVGMCVCVGVGGCECESCGRWVTIDR